MDDVDVAGRGADGAQKEREALLIEAEQPVAVAEAMSPRVGAFNSASLEDLRRAGRVDGDNKKYSRSWNVCFVVTMVSTPHPPRVLSTSPWCGP